MFQKSFSTPILFIIFNRPKVAQIVFNKIKEIKPKNLFIAADGPRKDILSDIDNCKKTREILNQIDWDCELKTFFRDENVGCGRGVSGAINWFFEHVEQGIILEDDCLPDLTFFEFAELMLNKYKNEEVVKMISGTNYLFNKIKRKESYYFSKCFFIWGWATWKRSWKQNDFNLNSWLELKSKNILKDKFYFKKKNLNKFWVSNLDSVFNKEVDTWDVQWFYSCLKNNGYAIVPINNLISNLGTFGAHGDGDETFINMQIKPIDINNIIHPKKIELDIKLDKITYKNIGVTKFDLRKRVRRIKFGIYTLLKKILFIKK